MGCRLHQKKQRFLHQTLLKKPKALDHHPQSPPNWGCHLGTEASRQGGQRLPVQRPEEGRKPQHPASSCQHSSAGRACSAPRVSVSSGGDSCAAPAHGTGCCTMAWGPGHTPQERGHKHQLQEAGSAPGRDNCPYTLIAGLSLGICTCPALLCSWAETSIGIISFFDL